MQTPAHDWPDQVYDKHSWDCDDQPHMLVNEARFLRNVYQVYSGSLRISGCVPTPMTYK
ncbi:hypothetical protein MGG_16594 [Pyricularia oryzae 70-15]|uniref:Uncharacterized protein n=3 Tax=Pyricularia oryzae TaxID=318829 RepID=G4MZX2_PYRO7|nr:uncharacterized protein MGG_16594 [Pyricularia oryzae 70-15]EHA51416.1 hypothetical protein MGG_16594 [Pyricularia oryzae 70-15]ELQ32857.1 hypothetical protein OOU_Y34scaffold01021g8 [Pyricularia oryzae Y34]KAI7912579.1 hypothetical protein M9X92_009927 [Pyricularia oryzae]KAI7913680.1 hypothetical protein M0657_009885 [Pyricularia oryzae]